jgi:hypothetical protein
MRSVEEIPLRSHYSVGSETAKEREQRYRMHSVGSSYEDAIQSGKENRHKKKRKNKHKRERKTERTISRVECIKSKKACYEAII